jgi:hypothetical protein
MTDKESKSANTQSNDHRPAPNTSNIVRLSTHRHSSFTSYVQRHSTFMNFTPSTPTSLLPMHCPLEGWKAVPI